MPGLAGLHGGDFYLAGERGSDWAITDEPGKARVFDSRQEAEKFIADADAHGTLACEATTALGGDSHPYRLVLKGVGGPKGEVLYYSRKGADGLVMVSGEICDSQLWFRHADIPFSLRNDGRFEVVGGES